MMRCLWCALLLMLCAIPANADELRPGYLEFTQRSAQDWTLVWKAPMQGGITSATTPILPQGCTPAGTVSRAVITRAVVTTSQWRCVRPVAGQQIGLANMQTSQTDVLVRVAPQGRPVQALRLTAADPLAEIKARPEAWQVAQTYFTIGIDHILFGYDHLLFVVALVLLLRGGWTVVGAVTAFTLAHSVTLVGTTLGLWGLPQRPVESVIALSIIFLAVEIAKQVPGAPRLSERAPWVVAFLFGLLHGFGFAGALKSIGLPEGDVGTALITFNLGVEAGQLAIVLATIALLKAAQRLAPTLVPSAMRAATYGIGITASYWFIARTFA